MLNLNDREWKAFFICDIFLLESTSSGIDGNKLSNEQGNIPYLTRTDLNNGYKSFVGQQAEKYKRDNGNCITIGLDTQTAFYQPHSFYTGQNVQVLKNDKLNKYNAKFFIPLLHNAMVSLNWGGNGATLGRLKKKKIVVPITDDGQPDYAFMEQYIREREDKLKQKYIDFVNAEFETPPIPLAEKTWGVFYLKDLFGIIQRGKRLVREHQQAGKMPYVSSTAMNNGIDGFISTERTTREFSNCLTIANSGSVGSSFYQPSKFIASDHITHLKNDSYTMYVYLFIATMTKRMSEKYNFNREINDYRISKEKILLPTTYEGSPDYEYMEQYIKAVMFGKYKKYLEYQKCPVL